MYADNTLTPKEAIRLCALGTLAHSPMRYSVLSGSVRHFVSRIAGPSLDLMGTSIELLRFEGLVEGIGGIGMEDDAELVLTDKGKEQLVELLCAPIRAQSNDVNKLIITLKFRFLNLLDGEERQNQVAMLTDACEAELGRLIDLRGHYSSEGGNLVSWLDHDIELLEMRLDWLEKFSNALG